MAPPLPNTMHRPRAIGLAFAVVGLLVWGIARQPSKNRERGEVLVLGGRHFKNIHNNQPAVGHSVRGDARAEARWAWSVGGGVIASFRVSNQMMKKQN